MLKRLRSALVRSFVGAVALGWVFAESVFHFAYMFSAPITGWLSRREYRGLSGQSIGPTGFSFQDAVPELIRSLSLLIVGYFLLRWLYFKPLEEETAGSGTEQGA
jgi:hypothetical protein